MDLFAISPIDGRYHEKISDLSDYFSEAALIKYRVLISIRYFEFITYHLLSSEEYEAIDFSFLNNNILGNLFSDRYRAIPILKEIKQLEKATNHDVMAVVEYLKHKFLNYDCGDSKLTGFFHLGLTSQDINTSAIMIPLQKFRLDVMLPILEKIRSKLDEMFVSFEKIMMCGFTHGQMATPTTFGHQMKVFEDRLKNQLEIMEDIPITTKFGGATGGMNALRLVYKTKYLEDHQSSNKMDKSEIKEIEEIEKTIDSFKELLTKLKAANSDLEKMERELRLELYEIKPNWFTDLDKEIFLELKK